jgi:uncharacterized protein (TIGR00266 family)
MDDQKIARAPGQMGVPTIPKPIVEQQGAGPSGINYTIVGTVLQAAILNFTGPQQMVYSNSGAMSWMSSSVVMNTNTGGGLGKMFGRMVSGSSIFVVDYSAPQGPGTAGFSARFPGKIVPILLAPGQSIIMQKHSFLVAEKSIELSVAFNRKLGSGFFGGEGFILQQFTGPGLCFAELDGEIIEYDLAPGQTMSIHPGHVGMFEPTVSFDIQMLRGFTNILFGGEGLFLATLTGPGKIWLQTMPMMQLAEAIAHYLPHSGGGNEGGLRINLGG